MLHRLTVASQNIISLRKKHGGSYWEQQTDSSPYFFLHVKQLLVFLWGTLGVPAGLPVTQRPAAGNQHATKPMAGLTVEE